MPAQTRLEQPTDTDPHVTVLAVTPLMASGDKLTDRLFDAATAPGTAALILVGYATGTTPTAINPFIKRSVENGVPVIVLSDNRGENTGPQRLKYETQVAAVEAGATPLKDINVNGLGEVVSAAREAARSGKAGQELADTLVSQYGTPSR